MSDPVREILRLHVFWPEMGKEYPARLQIQTDITNGASFAPP